MTTPKLGLDELANSPGNYLLANAVFAALDQLVMPRVVDKDLSTPPGSPANGAMYIVGGSPTGAWAGKANNLAWWLDAVNAWTFLAPAAGMSVRVLDELDGSGLPLVYAYSGTTWTAQPSGGGGGGNQSIIVACSDESTALTTGTAKVTFRMPYAFSLTGVRASLTGPQASGSILTIDINEGGASILSTKLTIDNNEKTSVTAATQPVISDTALADDAEITIDIDQVGDGTAVGLKVTLIGAPV